MPAILSLILSLLGGSLAAGAATKIGARGLTALGKKAFFSGAGKKIAGQASKFAATKGAQLVGSGAQAVKKTLPGFLGGGIPATAAELGKDTTSLLSHALLGGAVGIPAFLGTSALINPLLGLDEEFVPPGANSLVPEQITPIQSDRGFNELASILGSQTESGEINSPELENLLSLIQEERKPRLI